MTSPPPVPATSKYLKGHQWRFKTLTCPTEWVEHYRPGYYHPVHFGDVFKESRYKVIRKLGYGFFSTVWLARVQHAASGNKYVALKIVTANESASQLELDILSRLSNSSVPHDGQRHVMTLLDTFVHEGPNGAHRCMVFEAMGPSAADLLENHADKFGAPKMELIDWDDDDWPDLEDLNDPFPDESTEAEVGLSDQELDVVVEREDDSVNMIPPSHTPRFPLWMTKSIIHQVLLAIDFLHRNGITHSDLQPGNILFHVNDLSPIQEEQLSQPDGLKHTIPVRRKDGKTDLWAPTYLALNRSLADHIDLEREFQIKISDLGAAFFSAQPPEKSVTPTGLRSPELICNNETGPAQDIWSLGCLTFELITGIPLFPGDFGPQEEIDDAHFLQLYDLFGSLPQSLIDGWPRYRDYFNAKGEQIRNDVGKVPENFDPSSIENGLSLDDYLDAEKPSDIMEQEMVMLKDFLHKMLVVDPTARANASMLLEHPWITQARLSEEG